ncbi:hypothetical protein E3T53_11130 [Cryobacterium psychrophilum]|uniref:Uncharacterized protein n=1 Tax=Cryobacterium psychrophilum TaxID=41988 RepID=A0A4Y8KML5_9MICO|nr:hypothetical protein E3T53_11130 [Cryobacterium psychrophilum]
MGDRDRDDLTARLVRPPARHAAVLYCGGGEAAVGRFVTGRGAVVRVEVVGILRRENLVALVSDGRAGGLRRGCRRRCRCCARCGRCARRGRRGGAGGRRIRRRASGENEQRESATCQNDAGMTPTSASKNWGSTRVSHALTLPRVRGR